MLFIISMLCLSILKFVKPEIQVYWRLGVFLLLLYCFLESINFKPFLSLFIDISLVISVFYLKLSACVFKVLLDGRMSQIFNLGLSLILFKTTGNFCLFFKTFFF